MRGVWSLLLWGRFEAMALEHTHKPLPTPHRQFSVRIETTAHQLNATNAYPPYTRYLMVHYDYDARRARLDYEPVPHMPPKSFVRRYDLGFEFMVMEIRLKKECQKSKLREAMPMPGSARARAERAWTAPTELFEPGVTQMYHLLTQLAVL